MRFNGVFKGFTFRVRRAKFQLPLLRYLLALPHIKHIEPDQLFYPEAATGESKGLLGYSCCCLLAQLTSHKQMAAEWHQQQQPQLNCQ